MLEIGAVRKEHCNTCNIRTPHELRASSLRAKHEVEHQGTEFETVVWWEEHEYRFWICRVCNTATLEVNYRYNALPESIDEVSTLYPRRARLIPKKYQQFRNQSLRTIYHEVIETYNLGLKASCAAGLRVLLESICGDMGIEDKEPTRNLTAKLYALTERALVNAEIVDNLFALKFIGDDVIHRLKVPAEGELEKGVKVVESLISYLYKETEHQLSSQAQSLAEKRADQVEEQKRKKDKRKRL